MAPSAIKDCAPGEDVKGKFQADVVVNGEEEVTPLRAISHGILMPGNYNFQLSILLMAVTCASLDIYDIYDI